MHKINQDKVQTFTDTVQSFDGWMLSCWVWFLGKELGSHSCSFRCTLTLWRLSAKYMLSTILIKIKSPLQISFSWEKWIIMLVFHKSKFLHSGWYPYTFKWTVLKKKGRKWLCKNRPYEICVSFVCKKVENGDLLEPRERFGWHLILFLLLSVFMILGSQRALLC